MILHADYTLYIIISLCLIINTCSLCDFAHWTLITISHSVTSRQEYFFLRQDFLKPCSLRWEYCVCTLLFFKYLFIYWPVPGLSCSMWDPVPWPRIEPRLPALGAQSLSHWTTREAPCLYTSICQFFPFCTSQHWHVKVYIIKYNIQILLCKQSVVSLLFTCFVYSNAIQKKYAEPRV